MRCSCVSSDRSDRSSWTGSSDRSRCSCLLSSDRSSYSSDRSSCLSVPCSSSTSSTSSTSSISCPLRGHEEVMVWLEEAMEGAAEAEAVATAPSTSILQPLPPPRSAPVWGSNHRYQNSVATRVPFDKAELDYLRVLFANNPHFLTSGRTASMALSHIRGDRAARAIFHERHVFNTTRLKAGFAALDRADAAARAEGNDSWGSGDDNEDGDGDMGDNGDGDDGDGYDDDGGEY